MNDTALQLRTLENQQESHIDANASLKKALKIVNLSFNHEINNALTPILFMSGILKSRTKDPEVLTVMDLIQSSAKKIQEIVTSIGNLENQDVIHTTEYLHDLLMLDLKKPVLN